MRPDTALNLKYRKMFDSKEYYCEIIKNLDKNFILQTFTNNLRKSQTNIVRECPFPPVFINDT